MSAVNVVQTVDVKEFLDKIKSKGYWRVNIRPTKFERFQIESPRRCWELVESSKVSLRGWDYPYVGQKEKIDGEDSTQSGFDLDRFGHMELWRFYQSGQFIHYFACKEDYRMPNRIGQDSSGGMSILSTLYSVTEIFEFAARLAQKEVLKPKLQISIELVGMENRELFFWSANRDLTLRYTCDTGEMSFKEELSLTEIMAEGHNKALDITVRILEKFNWQNPPRSVLAEDQQRFLQRRL